MTIIERIKSLFKRKTLALKEGGSSETKELLDLLYTKNNELYETLNTEILQQQYVEKLGADKIEILSLYPRVQQELLGLSNAELDLFVKLLNYAQKEQNDWIPVTEDLISAVKNQNYNQIYNQFDQMSEDDKWKFLNIIFSRTDIFLGVNPTEDMQNYFERKKEIALPIINEPDKDHEQYEWSYELEKSSPIDRVRYAILGLKYGMTLEAAHTLYEAYAQDVESYSGTPEGNILRDIKSIMEEKDIKNLQSRNFDESEIDYKALINIESTLDNILVKKFNDKIYKPKEDDLIGTEEVKITDEKGKKKKVEVKVYGAIGEKSKEMYMITHSRGGIWGVYDFDSKQNYKEDWFRPNLKNNVISSCCVSNEFWGNVNGWCTFGFCDFKQNTLYDMAHTDAGSGRKDFGKNNFPQPHFSPKGLIDNTLGYNEMVWNRLELEDGQYNKKAPDYVVYMKRPKTDEQRTDKKSQKIYEDNEKQNWNEARKAAAELGIPIVVVDVEKSIEIESQSIGDMVKKFEITCGRDKELLRSIMTKFENNRGYLLSQSGNYEELVQRYFSKDSCKDYLTRIMKTIEQSDENTRQQSLDTLTDITLLERKKRMKFSGIKIEEAQYNETNIVAIETDSEEYAKYLENRTMNYDEFLVRLQQLKERTNENLDRINETEVNRTNIKEQKTTDEDDSDELPTGR